MLFAGCRKCVQRDGSLTAQALHFKADLTGATEQRLSGQQRVWVASPHVRRAACSFDGHFVWRWRFHLPVGGRPTSSWAETCRLHGRVVEIVPVQPSSLPFQSSETINAYAHMIELHQIHKYWFMRLKEKNLKFEVKKIHCKSCIFNYFSSEFLFFEAENHV